MKAGKRELIITIVKKGYGDTVLEASMKAGAEGGTVLFGRGIGIHEKKKIMGLRIEPEKEIVLTATPPDMTKTILDAIVKEARLGVPGMGIAFTVPINSFVGVVHAQLEESSENTSDQSGD
ncbi:MAG TPA: P-II family nitrogen regulator [Dehalococcoidales bacterium]|nr:P-II family nitrogen regulator [Dehalococcoidales bacterium]